MRTKNNKCICGHLDKYHILHRSKFECSKCGCPEFRPLTPHDKEVIKLLKEILKTLKYIEENIKQIKKPPLPEA